MDWLITGKIRGSFGLDGFLKVESCSGEYEHFLDLDEVRISFPKAQKGQMEGCYTVEDCVVRADDVLIKLRGVDTPEAAKQFYGADISVPRNMACPLNEGEFYIKDICNAVLVYKGQTVGTVTDIVEGGGGFLLELSEAATGTIPVLYLR